MARSFLTAINLNKNELQNAAVQNLGTAPSAPVKGQLYFDSTGNVMYWWSGTAWVAAMDAGGSGFPGYAPGGSTVAETTFGLAKADGVATTVARADHTHGSPTHGAADHTTIPISTFAAAIANVNMGGFVINNVGAPLQPTDAANKAYVDNVAAGLSWKDSVRLATTTDIALTGLLTVDGVVTAANDRVLVKNQTNAIQNGVWMTNVGAWSRTSDTDGFGEMNGMAVFVESGTTQGDTAWVITTDSPIIPGTTALTFAQFAGGGTVTAGAGMTQSGNTLNVIGDATMVIAADSIGQAPLTGDVTTAAGANAATITDGVVTNAKLANMATTRFKGRFSAGTGPVEDMNALTAAGLLGAYVARKAMQQVPPTAVTSYEYFHNLNNGGPVVQVYRSAAPNDTVECDVERTSINSVTLRWAVAPAVNEYVVTVVG